MIISNSQKSNLTTNHRLPTTYFGFTLIELLVVIGIIAILTGVSIFALQGGRTSGRDGRRQSDLQTIAGALELFKADCNIYPPTITGGSALNGSSCVPPNGNVYMQSVPTDPSGANYIYRRITNVTFEICATLEQPPVVPQPCAAGGNYRVTNP